MTRLDSAVAIFGLALFRSFVGAEVENEEPVRKMGMPSDTYLREMAPVPSREEQVCKRVYKEFLKCSIEKDWDPYISGWDKGRECLEEDFKEVTKQHCPTTVLEYHDAEEIPNGKISPGYLAVMGIYDGLTYGFFAVPDYTESKVFDISCFVCEAFATKVMNCLLPLKIEKDKDAELEAKMAKCVGTSGKNLALAAQCLDGAPWYQMEPDENGYLTFAHVSPVLVAQHPYEVCHSIEGVTEYDFTTREAIVSIYVLPDKDHIVPEAGDDKAAVGAQPGAPAQLSISRSSGGSSSTSVAGNQDVEDDVDDGFTSTT